MRSFFGSKHLLSVTRQTVSAYAMLEAGDTVAVALSGGKDSVSLLCTLALLRKFYPIPFNLQAITIDMGFPGADFAPLAALCKEFEVPYHVEHTEIAELVFAVRKEKNPCSLCAALRRGALQAAASRLQCTKLALGHHLDDAVETFLMRLLFEGQLYAFSPVTRFSDGGISLIRPFCELPQKDIAYFAKKNALPIVKNPCPQDHATQREEMRSMLQTLEKSHPGTRHRILTAMKKWEIDGFKVTDAAK